TSISGLLSPQVLGTLSTTTVTVAALLLVAGVVGKSAQFPLHTWLPDAMEGPTPVSALIHAATMVAAGGYVLARLLPLLLQAPGARGTLAVLASVSMLGAALVALAQDDLKRVLAWSTISQVGYLLAALAVTPADLGSAPAVVHLLSHAGFKALLFLSAGALAHQVHTTALAGLAGSWRRAPLVTVLFTIGLASLAGLPGLSGFWSKEAVLGAAEQTAHDGGTLAWAGWLVLVVGLLTGLVTAVYATRTFLLVVPAGVPAGVDAGAGGRREAPPQLVPVSADGSAERSADGDQRPPDVAPAPTAVLAPPAPVPAAMVGPLVLLAVPAALGGLLLVGPVVPGELHLTLATGVLAAVLSLAGVALAVVAVVLLRRRPARDGAPTDAADVLPARLRSALAAGFGLDALGRWLVVRPTQGLARLVAAGDREVVDAYVRGAATSARWAGAALRRTQTGVATGYLTWLVVGALVVAVAGVGLR
ncbi:MAG TPA: proton-conducting transporter membrane subunit, partial [Actinomycetales bacterium]